jgi:hypothetical protein
MKFIIFAFALGYSGMALADGCTAPWGGYVGEGQMVQAYRESKATGGNRCEWQYRTCNNGFLSGWYMYQSCYEDYSCNTPEFGWIPHMSSVIAYQNPAEYGGRRCQQEVRYCQYARMTGSYRYRYCNEHP